MHVRIGVPAPYEWQYNDRSWFATAHCDGYIAIFIESFNLSISDRQDVLNRQIQVFSDGTSWTDTHINEGSGYYPSDTWFWADRNRVYNIWVWCSTSGDGDGGDQTSSHAWGTVSVSLPYIVIEQSMGQSGFTSANTRALESEL
jgi:hypothetical protein